MKTDLRCDAVLFDMDGTILDTIPLITESFQYAFKKHLGTTANEADILSGIGIPLERVFAQYAPDLAAQMMNDYTEHNCRHFSTHIGMFIGFAGLFIKLKALGLKLGVVTSKRLTSALGSMEPFGIEKNFDLIQGKEATSRHKPDPEPLHKAMSDLGLNDPSRVVYVGDSIHDLLCAQAAGCITAIVDWTRMPKQELRDGHPDLWLNKPDDLYRWVVND